MIRARIHPVLPLVMAALVLTGCARGGLPSHVLRLTPESLQNRALQTRKFEGISEADLLSASTGVIQDLGFTITGSETNLGLLVGSKKRDARPSAKQVVGRGATALITGILVGALVGDVGSAVGTLLQNVSLDDYQRFWVSIVIRPTSKYDDKTHYVRVTFQRVVWDEEDEIDRLESLDEAEMYQEFFGLLSKSVFLEGQEI